MSKELTEQWRNGELPNGTYYVRDWDGTIDWFVAHNKILWRNLNNPIYTSERIEVLSPVPDYPDLCELKQELEICKDEKADLYAKLCNALMQLEECKQKLHILNEANMKLENTVGKLCEQLNDANYAIKHYKYCSSGFKVDKEGSVIDKFIARSYLDKWGVK